MQDDAAQTGTEVGRTGATMGHRWREYPVGFSGELARMFVRTLVPFGVMLMLTFLIILIVGIMMDEGLGHDLLRTMGYDFDTRDAITTSVEYLFRVSMMLLMIVGYLAGLGVCIALCARDITASTAVAAAAADGAPRDAVPTPRQVESIIKRRFVPLRMLLIISAGTAVLLGGLMVIVALVEDERGVIAGGIAVLAVGVVLGLGFWFLQRVLEPRHRQRRQLIAAHWTQQDEQAAWRVVSDGVDDGSPVTHGVTRHRLVNAGVRVGNLGIRFGALAVILLYGLFFITHPEANRLTREAGPRANYSEPIEQALTVGFWAMGTLMALCIVGAVLGQVIEGIGREVERSALRDLMDRPNPPRPPAELVEDYGQRRAVRLAQALAMLSGIAVILGPAAWWLATVRSELFSRGVELFAPFRDTAMLTTVAAVVLFLAACAWNAAANVRATPIRNAIIARWPQPPTDQKDSDGKKIPARVGPALRWKPANDDQ